MREYKVYLSQDKWKYASEITINADSLEKTGINQITVNGAVIEFEEEIEVID